MELKMMGGGKSDFSRLTATNENVTEDMIFYGAGSDEEQRGRLPNMEKIRSSPGLSEAKPEIPIHSADNVEITTDTYGIKRIALSPQWGRYPGGGKAYVGCTPEELGIIPEAIRNGDEICGVEGEYGNDGNITEDDIKEGKVGYNSAGRIIGNRKDYGTVNKTIGAGETYDIKKGMYDAGTITAKTLASQTAGTATSEDIIKSKTATVNGKEVVGSMPELSDETPIKFASNNNTKVIAGDACYQQKNTDGVERLLIRYNGAKGRIKQNTLFGIPLNLLRKAIGYTDTSKVLTGTTIAGQGGSMANRGAVDQALDPGATYTVAQGYHNGTGKVKAKNKYVKLIYVDAIRGFGASSSDYEPGPNEESFTMPADGMVYYGGFSTTYNASGNVICEIYKNGTVVDSRNIDNNNRWNWRGTMYKKSFSVKKGDVIKARAAATSGAASMALLHAEIVYFM